MRSPRPGTNTAIFLVFFGVALADAIWSHNWLRALLWFGFGALFILADMKSDHA